VSIYRTAVLDIHTLRLLSAAGITVYMLGLHSILGVLLLIALVYGEIDNLGGILFNSNPFNSRSGEPVTWLKRPAVRVLIFVLTICASVHGGRELNRIGSAAGGDESFENLFFCACLWFFKRERISFWLSAGITRVRMFFSLSRRNVEIRRSWKSAYRLYSGK
jgi:hypothetical protein